MPKPPKLHDHICFNPECRVFFQHIRKDALFHSKECARDYNSKHCKPPYRKTPRKTCGFRTGGKLYSCSGPIEGARPNR